MSARLENFLNADTTVLLIFNTVEISSLEAKGNYSVSTFKMSHLSPFNDTFNDSCATLTLDCGDLCLSEHMFEGESACKTGRRKFL